MVILYLYMPLNKYLITEFVNGCLLIDDLEIFE